MPRRFAALFVIASGCSAAHPVRGEREAAVFHETFDDPVKLQRDWSVVSSGEPRGTVRFEASAATLTLSEHKRSSGLRLRHVLDVASLRGRRIRLTARARTTGTTARAVGILATTDLDRSSSYDENASSRVVDGVAWAVVDTVLDVDPRAISCEVALELQGTGTAWWDDVNVSIIGPARSPSSTQLTARQVEHLAALARAATSIRYLHPSDQSAILDWDGFWPSAVRRVLSVRDSAQLASELRAVFEKIAPTVRFYPTGRAVPAEVLPRGSHLARWHSVGLGSGGMFKIYRDGRDPDEDVRVERSLRLAYSASRPCKRVRVEATVRRPPSAGKVSVVVAFRSAAGKPTELEQTVGPDMHEVALEGDVPPEAREIRVGLTIDGRGDLAIDTVKYTCDGTTRGPIDLAGEWTAIGRASLYDWTTGRCSSGSCAALGRKPLDTQFVADRDVYDADLGAGVHMRMPLAVWVDARGTLPFASIEQPYRDSTVRDLETRLAAVASAWGTLATFYPYFGDQQIDWEAALPTALREAAAAVSTEQLHDALAHLVAALKDDHGRVTHAGAPIDGVTPIALRRFGDRLVVVGGLPAYAAQLPPGTEVQSIDGVRADRRYDQIRARVSAATRGWQDYAVPFYATIGAVGTFRRFHVRAVDGREADVTLPLVSRDQYDDAVREARPKSGSEVAPGVYYVDFEGLETNEWTKLLPVLEKARGIVIDLRGYTTNTGVHALAHFSMVELRSPLWQIPIIGGHPPTEARFETSQWTMLPASPHLGAPVVALADGRAASAVETILQIVRENRIARVVGETSGGTNGNVSTFTVPGDFAVRFTAMRVAGADGGTVQGRGVSADLEVHPTLEGVRAGRDEVLEAGISEVQRLATK